MNETAKTRQTKPYERDGVGILNPWGDFWTGTIFETEEKARKYFEGFWRGDKNAPDITKYQFVPARQTTVVAPTP